MNKFNVSDGVGYLLASKELIIKISGKPLAWKADIAIKDEGEYTGVVVTPKRTSLSKEQAEKQANILIAFCKDKMNKKKKAFDAKKNSYKDDDLYFERFENA